MPGAGAPLADLQVRSMRESWPSPFPPSIRTYLRGVKIYMYMYMKIDRSDRWLGSWRSTSFLLDPVGSSPPRLPPRSKLDALAKVQGQGLTLLCEAQASPPPLYR